MRIMGRWSNKLILIVFPLLLTSCGYDVALKYKLESSVSYQLKIDSDYIRGTSSAMKEELAKEGLVPIRFAETDAVNERYYLHDKYSRTFIIMYHDEPFKTAILAVYPSRFFNNSSYSREKLSQRESQVKRVAEALKETKYFSGYVILKDE